MKSIPLVVKLRWKFFQEKVSKRTGEVAPPGPCSDSVFTKNLVNKEVKGRDVLEHQAAYFKDTHQVPN